MKHTRFDTSWLFSLDGAEETMVNLPHDFSMTKGRNARAFAGKDGGWYEGGVGVYKKHFPRPKEETVFLSIDGCQGLTEVYLNRNRVLFHPNGYTPFCINLTPYLREGENTLEIRVNSVMQPSARWYTGSGLNRKAEILTAGKKYILPGGLYIRSEDYKNGTFAMRAEIETSGGDGCVQLAVSSPDGNTVYSLSAPSVNGKAVFDFSLTTDLTWTAEHPFLWKAEANFEGDTLEIPFGVKHVAIDKENGLLINGESVKLRGGCVHHDNGMLGARSNEEIELRRILLLKKAGFNAIRTSHNPPSEALLNICDQMGMYVLDEAFDCWRHGKTPFDYHLFFDDWWERDLRSMLRRDRTHPSIVMWSNGNEIPERSGLSGGYEIMKQLSRVIREMDNRPVTHALCSFWDVPELVEAQKLTENDPVDAWARVTNPIAEETDVAGYNYSHDRVEKDRRAFKDRVFLLTETFALSAASSWKAVTDHKYVIGDFVWTAWDYIGESGIGHLVYDADETRGLMPYPWHLANCADFDLTGYRRPQSYLREIVWGMRDTPYIAVKHPKNHNRKCALSMWGFYDVHETWSFKGYEQQMTDVCVFSDADEIELFVNRQSQGKMRPDENRMCVFTVAYIPGEIRALAYTNGVPSGEFALHTPDEGRALSIRNVHAGEKYVFFDICVEDNSGVRVFEDAVISVEPAGTEELYLSNGDPTAEESYTGRKMCARNGKITCAVIKKDAPVSVKAVCALGETILKKEFSL